MSWNNNRGYNNSYNNNNNNYNGGGQQRQQKKKSGAKMGFALGEASRPFVRGWRASKRFGLVTYMCGTYKGTKRHESKTGRQWENWCVKVTPQNAAPFMVSGLYDVQGKKVIVKDLGIVINPNAPNGGYCGRFGTKR